ncbi:hypothetical protein [Alicyclobacillus shizuokensis]|uniref:hypothetical protein n=1 Tax=Alicyclobacillus shizuokensis TaxID=392014 RepID=UPI000834E754|nr:hypothetical protein [Alicyclobacillus shizuokensis]
MLGFLASQAARLAWNRWKEKNPEEYQKLINDPVGYATSILRGIQRDIRKELYIQRHIPHEFDQHPEKDMRTCDPELFEQCLQLWDKIVDISHNMSSPSCTPDERSQLDELLKETVNQYMENCKRLHQKYRNSTSEG